MMENLNDDTVGVHLRDHDGSLYREIKAARERDDPVFLSKPITSLDLDAILMLDCEDVEIGPNGSP